MLPLALVWVPAYRLDTPFWTLILGLAVFNFLLLGIIMNKATLMRHTTPEQRTRLHHSIFRFSWILMVLCIAELLFFTISPIQVHTCACTRARGLLTPLAQFPPIRLWYVLLTVLKLALIALVVYTECLYKRAQPKRWTSPPRPAAAASQ